VTKTRKDQGVTAATAGQEPISEDIDRWQVRANRTDSCAGNYGGRQQRRFPCAGTENQGRCRQGSHKQPRNCMRQAKSGGLLIEVRGDHKEVEAIRAEIARSAGPA